MLGIRDDSIFFFPEFGNTPTQNWQCLVEKTCFHVRICVIPQVGSSGITNPAIISKFWSSGRRPSSSGQAVDEDSLRRVINDLRCVLVCYEWLSRTRGREWLSKRSDRSSSRGSLRKMLFLRIHFGLWSYLVMGGGALVGTWVTIWEHVINWGLEMINFLNNYLLTVAVMSFLRQII